MEKGKLRLTVVLLLGLTVFGVPLMILGPALLSIARSFGFEPADRAISLVWPFLFLSWVVMPPLCAPLSNLLGKRRFLMAAAVTAIAGMVLMSLAKSLSVVYVANFILGCGGMCFQIIGTSALFDLFPQSRASAVTLSQTVSGGFALVVPPFVNFVVGPKVGWDWHYIYLGFAAIPLAVLAVVSTQQFPQAAPERTNFRAVANLFKMPFFLFMGFAMLVYGTIEQSIGNWLPAYMEKDLLVAAGLAALPSTFYSITMMLGRVIGGAARLADRIPYSLTIIYSSILGMGAIYLGAATTNPAVAGISFAMLGMLICLIWPAILAAAIDTTGEDSTTVMGGIIFFGGTGALLGAFFIGPLTEVLGSMRLAFRTVLVPCAVLVIIFFFVHLATRGKAAVAPARTEG